MRAIYASASETVIYLGPDDGSIACRSAWNFLESRSSWAMNNHGDRDKMVPKTREKDVNYQTAYNDLLISVITREWFTRIWVIQEMVVSQYLSIQCGNRRIPWNDFCQILFLYSSPLHSQTGDNNSQREPSSVALESLQASTSENYRHVTEMKYSWEVVTQEVPGWKNLIQSIKEMCQTRLLYQRTVRDPNIILPAWVLNDPLAHFVADDTEFRQGSLRLAHLLAKSRKLHATDPRDKAIALLGISAPLGSTDIQSLVNYNQPVHQTYREVTRFILEAESTFDILSQAGQTSQIEDLNFSSWAGNWSEQNFPPTSVLSRLGGEADELKNMRSLIVSQNHTWSNEGKVLGCTGGILGELVAVGELGISSQSKTSIDDPADWFNRWKEFIPSAKTLIKNSKWTIAEQATNINLTKTVTDMAQGSFHVTISLDFENNSDKLPVRENLFIAGGGGFTSDVFALREGRMLGILRSVPQNLDGTARDKEAAYSWGVVPKSAKVGDLVATFTGSRVLFLLYPHLAQSEGEDERREDIENVLRSKLPKHDDRDASIVHCRLRGECRVSGYEDMWKPVFDMNKEQSQRPWMTYIGSFPRQFRAVIFALH